MRPLEEVTAWSLLELQAELEEALPEGCGLEISRSPEGEWHVSLPGMRDESGPDLRLLLLDLYTWLFLRCHDKPGSALWDRRRETSLVLVTVGSNIPDPADLDPSQIELVYGHNRR